MYRTCEMSKADAAAVNADNQPVVSSGEAVPNNESQLAIRGTRTISKPGLQPQVTAVEKIEPLRHSAGWHETQVMTVLVSKLTARGASSAEEMDTDGARLFSRPTTRLGLSPPGTGARAPSAGRMSADIASAKAGAAGGTFPAVVTPRGPNVTSQAPVLWPANGVARTGVGVASGTAPGYAVSPGPAGVCMLHVLTRVFT
ncbi:hypothetical protein MTO96_035763 [Rhipicephalus appendiculatus]